MRGLKSFTKSFIEVTNDRGEIRLVNIDFIVAVAGGGNGTSVLQFSDGSSSTVKHTYTELRQTLAIRCQVIRLDTGKEVPRE